MPGKIQALIFDRLFVDPESPDTQTFGTVSPASRRICVVRIVTLDLPIAFELLSAGAMSIQRTGTIASRHRRRPIKIGSKFPVSSIISAQRIFHLTDTGQKPFGIVPGNLHIIAQPWRFALKRDSPGIVTDIFILTIFGSRTRLTIQVHNRLTGLFT